MRRLFDYGSPLMRNLIRLFDCMCLSVLWLICSLPIVTMGAASAALYTAVYRYIRRDEGYLWRTYWDAFRENFKRSTLAWLVPLGLLVLLVVDALVFRGMLLQGKVLGNLYWLILILICLVLVWAFCLSGYAARFNGSVREILHFSAVLVLLHPVRTVQMFLPMLGGAALLLIFPALLILVPAAVCWIGSITLEKVFLQHMRPEDLERQQAADGVQAE